MSYTPTTWVDGETPVNAENLNHLEQGLSEIYTAMENGDFDGKDGTSATHSWNGTTLTITSAAGTSSSDLKGDKGDTGASGKTPVKGTDYFTDEDKAELVDAVIAALPDTTGVDY